MTTPAQTSSATQSLLDKAHALETRGRMDMAAQTWQQVLLVDPRNAEALGGLARSARLAGNNALAKTYLDKLRAVNPNDPGIARAEAVTSQVSQTATLQEAGRLAGQGRYAQAMALYRQVFGTQPPAGAWALAYYQTEAATEQGRAHAIAGLRSLAALYPQDARYGIALGRILTYDPRTRAEGRRMLERQVSQPEAAEALRQSQLWDSKSVAAASAMRRSGTRSEASAGTIPHYRGEDAALNAAYAALNAKHFTDADARFQAILAQDPQNARALAGAGYLRMNQQDFAGAITFLEKAKEKGARDAGLDKNLEAARFYNVLGQAGVALDNGDLRVAEQDYRQALRMRQGSPEALQGLGGTLLKAGEPQAAIPIFQQSIHVHSDAAAWRGLFLAQSQAGEAAEALQTDRNMPPPIRSQLVQDPEYLRTLAAAYTTTGQDAEAQRVLQAALDLPFPAGARGVKADTELQYASLLLAANRAEQASGLYRQVLAANPNNVLAWQGLVNAQHGAHNDVLALQTLESMPPAVYEQALRDTGFLSVAASVYQANHKYDLAGALLESAVAAQNTAGQLVPVPLQLQLAGVYLQRNDPTRALPIYQRVVAQNPQRADAWRGLLAALHTAGRDREALAQIRQIPPSVRRQLENDVAYLQTVGSLYSGLGEPRQALVFQNRVQQHYAAEHTVPPADVSIQNAWLLYNGMDDARLYRQLLDLGGRADLSDDQRRTVQTIWASWAVRRANQASAAGDSKRALAILHAAQNTFPDNPAVIRALAGGYQRAGQPREAVAIFKTQNMTTASASDYRTAIGAALAANDTRSAETWLRYGLDQYPQDSGMLALAAKFEQARGDGGRAIEYYRASLAAMPAQDPGAELAVLLRAPLPLNPRALPSPQRSQDLAALLAPADPAGIRQTSSQPYLPTDATSGSATPASTGMPASTAIDGAAAVVPPYMTAPAGTDRRAAGGSSQRRSTLGDYVPAPPVAAPLSYPMPADGYAPPLTAAPEGALSTPGMAAVVQPAGTSGQAEDGWTSPELAQQEQVRRAADESIAVPPDQSQAVGLLAATSAAETKPRQHEEYGAYIPYVPPSNQALPMVSYQANPVDLPSQTIVTDFPTGPGKLVPLHNARSSRRGKLHHAEDDAAEAAAIRRHQSEPEIVQGATDADTTDEVVQVEPAQYGGSVNRTTGSALQPAPGQSPRPSSLPATAPTGSLNSESVMATSSTNSSTPRGATTTVTATFPGKPSQARGTYGQQYPQPARRGAATPHVAAQTAKRKTTRKQVSPVNAFGPGAPPVFYPPVPTALSAEPYPDLPPYNEPGQPPTDAQLMAHNLPPLRGSESSGEAAVAGPPLTERQQTEQDLAQLEASYSGWAGGSAWVRARSGDPGITRLVDFELPFEASVVAGHAARFSVVSRGVFLNSGTVDNTRYATGVVPYLGTLPAASANTPLPQYASGLGGELQIATQNLAMAVGYTPYQFLVANVTGRFRYRPAGGPITLFAERDSIRETQLSYAGLRDPGSISLTNSGNVWGGVVATGGGLRFDSGNERSGLYASADYAALTGHHVLENRRVEATVGAYFRVHSFPRVGTLNVGASLFGAHFDRNERATSYGLGGYFSPNIYFLGTVPVTFTGHAGNTWHYVIQAAAGLQTFQENNDPYFPLPEDSALQTAALQNCSALSLQQRNCVFAYQPLNSSTGANFSVNGQVSYRISEHWYAGAALAANNTNNYNVVQPTVFLRYLFRPQYATEDYPTGLFPVEGFRPLRVP